MTIFVSRGFNENSKQKKMLTITGRHYQWTVGLRTFLPVLFHYNFGAWCIYYSEVRNIRLPHSHMQFRRMDVVRCYLVEFIASRGFRIKNIQKKLSDDLILLNYSRHVANLLTDLLQLQLPFSLETTHIYYFLFPLRFLSPFSVELAL